SVYTTWPSMMNSNRSRDRSTSMSVPDLLRATGRICWSRAAQVAAPTTPSTSLSLAAFCNAKTACCVVKSNLPSMWLVQEPNELSCCCRRSTGSPLLPIRSFGWLGGGGWVKVGAGDGLAGAVAATGDWVEGVGGVDFVQAARPLTAATATTTVAAR